jgi:hypothetical protein
MTARHTHFLVLVLLALATQPAFAQRFFGSRSNSLVSLAANEVVQKDIGVNGDLAAKLEALNDEYRNASQKEFSATGIDFSAVSDLPALERAAEMRKITEKTSTVNRKLATVFLPKLQELLTTEQIQRLKQIQLQANGVDSWLEPEFVKELDLTAEQSAKLVEIRAEYSRRQQQLEGDFTQRIVKSRELNAERDNRALGHLTDQQKGRLAELKGSEFDVSQLGLRRRGNN